MFHLRIDDDTELRLLEERHAEEELTLWRENRKEYLRWFPGDYESKTLEHTKRGIKDNLEKFTNYKGFAAGIWFKGTLAGVIDFHRIDWANRIAGLGYWLGASFQGKGLMTKACQTMVDYAFNELKLNRVQIRCATENKKSRAIPGRLGFKQEGIIRQAEWLYDHFVDDVVYGMLASEWPQCRSAYEASH